MSGAYAPDPASIPSPLDATVTLSQRDLGLRVPINFVTVPGVSFSAACFSHLVYEDQSFKTCFSNLLAGFRRFEVDLYWDQGRQVWSLCPVSIATNLPNVATTSALPAATATATANPLSAIMTGPSLAMSNLVDQISTSSSLSPSPTATSTSLPLISSNSSEPEFSFPPYTCTPSLNLAMITTLLADYIQQSQNTLAAHIIYLMLNIHAAASAGSPISPAPSPTVLPSNSGLLGSIFSSNLSAVIYTPSSLLSDRANLNSTWYTVPERYRPASGYYNTSNDPYGIVSTPDGWPSESYVEFSRGKRLLLGYGTIDRQMAKYNSSGDGDVIFPPGFIQVNQTVEAGTKTNDVTSGCFVLSNLTNLAITNINSSWATATKIDFSSSFIEEITPSFNTSSSLINCGISSILNHTLSNATATENYTLYQKYTQSTIWSWSPGEPRNFSESSEPGTDALFRCARTSLDTPHGKWRVEDCSQKLFAACRMPSQPYNWTLTTYQVSYSYAAPACPSPYIFLAPQTALENSYLHQFALQNMASGSHHSGLVGSSGIWINFNSIDMRGCWVTGGVNASCPYSGSMGLAEEVQRRNILVPTVAALITLVVTALTVFVKVVGNRSVSRRSKRYRKRDVMFYEGVPS